MYLFTYSNRDYLKQDCEAFCLLSLVTKTFSLFVCDRLSTVQEWHN